MRHRNGCHSSSGVATPPAAVAGASSRNSVRRILYDTNVVLDVLLARREHLAASAAALALVEAGRIEGYVAAHAVTTIAYLLQRQVGTARSRAVLAHLLSRLRVAAVTERTVRTALSAFHDFEDAVCHAPRSKPAPS